MKNVAVCLFVVTGFAPTAMAQPKDSRASIEVRGAADLPVGDFGDSAGFGYGGGVALVYALHKQFKVTASLDLLYHLEKTADTGFAGDNDVQLLQFPLGGGIRFHVAKEIFIFGNGGLNVIRATATLDENDTKSKLFLRAGAGYDAGPVDIVASLMFSALDNAGETMQIIAALQIPIFEL